MTLSLTLLPNPSQGVQRAIFLNSSRPNRALIAGRLLLEFDVGNPHGAELRLTRTLTLTQTRTRTRTLTLTLTRTRTRTLTRARARTRTQNH